MAKINLQDIRPGMVLESDLKDRNGHVLLGSNNTITEKHLKIFKMWGVTEANIQGVKKEDVTAKAVSHLDPALLKEIEEKTRERFRHVNMQHPFNDELFRLLTIRFARRKPEGGQE